MLAVGIQLYMWIARIGPCGHDAGIMELKMQHTHTQTHKPPQNPFSHHTLFPYGRRWVVCIPQHLGFGRLSG